MRRVNVLIVGNTKASKPSTGYLTSVYCVQHIDPGHMHLCLGKSADLIIVLEKLLPEAEAILQPLLASNGHRVNLYEDQYRVIPKKRRILDE